MNVLITGGSGFIGSHVVDKLMAAGHFVRVLDVRSPHREDVDFCRGSIVSEEDVEKSIQDMEIVYHFGGFSNINLVKGNPLEAIRLNIMGTAYMLEACRIHNIKRFLFASSVYVHDEKGHLYTTGKLASELLCKNYQTLYSLPYTILRIGTVYGQRSRDADVISIFVQRALRNERLTIHGSGNQKRNFIYVEDLAEACVVALDKKASNETFVVAGSESVTIKELAFTVRDIVGNDIEINFNYKHEREGDYLGAIDGLGKMTEFLGWRQRTSLAQGIKKYIQWLKERNIE